MDEGQRAEFFDLLIEKYAPLNAIGKPFSPSYDPKYKVRTPLTSINRLRLKPPKIKDPKPQLGDIGNEHIKDFRALDDADEHVIDYYSVMEEAFGNARDCGPMPENLRQAS